MQEPVSISHSNTQSIYGFECCLLFSLLASGDGGVHHKAPGPDAAAERKQPGRAAQRVSSIPRMQEFPFRFPGLAQAQEEQLLHTVPVSQTAGPAFISLLEKAAQGAR